MWLDQVNAAIDWAAVETIVDGIYASREGGLAYPLLTYLKLLLLQQWYGLSDEGLEAAVDDRLSFRRFAGLPLAAHDVPAIQLSGGDTRPDPPLMQRSPPLYATF